jgi:hypothetical protein
LSKKHDIFFKNSASALRAFTSERLILLVFLLLTSRPLFLEVILEVFKEVEPDTDLLGCKLSPFSEGIVVQLEVLPGHKVLVSGLFGILIAFFSAFELLGKNFYEFRKTLFIFKIEDIVSVVVT